MKPSLLLLAIVLAVAARQARAGQVETTSSCSTIKSNKECTFETKIKGEITASTIDEIRKAFAQWDEFKTRERVSGAWGETSINSGGGSVHAAIEIGRV